MGKHRDGHKTLIAYGDGESGPCIKGYVRTPLKLIHESLNRNQNCDVVLINEFRTTKLCSCCYGVLKTSKSPHRFQVCQTCRKVWNRDVNAARNIKYLMKCKVEGAQPHHSFERKKTISMEMSPPKGVGMMLHC